MDGCLPHHTSFSVGRDDRNIHCDVCQHMFVGHPKCVGRQAADKTFVLVDLTHTTAHPLRSVQWSGTVNIKIHEGSALLIHDVGSDMVMGRTRCSNSRPPDCNLKRQEAAMAQNLINRDSNGNSADAANVKLPRGVSYHKRDGKYVARACINGNIKWLGAFKTAEEAAAVAEEARRVRDEAKPPRQEKKVKQPRQTTSLSYLRNREFSIELIRQIISYDPISGDLFWGPRPLEFCNSVEWFEWWNSAMVGRKIKGRGKNGCLKITIKSKKYYAHDIAWAITHGRWPRRPIIHLNGNQRDNRIENLSEGEQ